MSTEKKRDQLVRSLSSYAGGRFETSGSGGANGMMFHRDASGRQFYIGSFQDEHAHRIVEALNCTMALLESKE